MSGGPPRTSSALVALSSRARVASATLKQNGGASVAGATSDACATPFTFVTWLRRSQPAGLVCLLLR
jgi:hypothetical protein